LKILLCKEEDFLFSSLEANMNNNKAMLLMGGGTLGIIGALLLWDYAAIGAPLLIAAAIMVAMTIHGSKTKPKHEISHQMVIETTDQKHQQMMQFVSGPEMTPELQTLLKALRKTNLPSKAPVFIGDHNETLMNVQDVLAEMITQAKAYDIPLGTLEQNAAKIYDRIFANVEAACRAKPKELEAACIWLANRTLKDIQGELKAKPTGRFEGMFDDMLDK
jgi:hypothetical protein